MDSGVQNTQRIVVTVSILIGLLILTIIGYSLYRKANIAQGELAKKIALDNVTKKIGDQAAVSLTGEAKNTSLFSFDNLTQKNNNTATATDTSTQVVNEAVTATSTSTLPPQEDIQTPVSEDPTSIVTPKPKTVYKPRRVYADTDLPLTAAQIRAIRALPIDSSPSGVLQNQLEIQSGGEYKAQY